MRARSEIGHSKMEHRHPVLEEALRERRVEAEERACEAAEEIPFP